MFVRPKISEQQAKDIFSSRKSILPISLRSGKKKKKACPEKVEIIYLPFYLLDVSVKRGDTAQKDVSSSTQRVRLSVDGLLGHSVMYAEEGLELQDNLNLPAHHFVISRPEAEKIALKEYRGILLEHGLRTRSSPQVEEVLGIQEIYYPFWIVYFKKGRGYDFKALDAVSGEIQGVKMRRVFLNAFRGMAK